MTAQYEDPKPSLPISPGKLIFGLTLAIAGVLLTADNLGYIEAYPFLRLWPLALIAIGTLKLFDPGARDIAILLLIFGGWTMLLNLGLISFTFFDLWPLILIAIGIGFVRRAFRREDEEPTTSRLREFAGRQDLALLTTRRVRPGPSSPAADSRRSSALISSISRRRPSRTIRPSSRRAPSSAASRSTCPRGGKSSARSFR